MDFASLGPPSEARRGYLNFGGEAKKVICSCDGVAVFTFWGCVLCEREFCAESEGGNISLGYARLLLGVCLFIVTAVGFRISIFVACSVVNAAS